MKDNKTLRRRLGVAALAALALPLAGCGEDSKAMDTMPAPATLADGTTVTVDPELVRWAGSVCDVVAAQTKDLTPAQINPDDPSATVRAFSEMFGTMAELLGNQRTGLDKVEAPSDRAVAEQYTVALRRLDEAKAVVSGAAQRLSRVSPDNPEELVKALASVGDLQVGDRAYPGLVPDLGALAPTFGEAARQAPACDSVPGV